jgi:hypothetical protein
MIHSRPATVPFSYRFANHSRSTALILVCEPSPSARNASITSASRRIVVESFGRGVRGRPGLTGARRPTSRPIPAAAPNSRRSAALIWPMSRSHDPR